MKVKAVILTASSMKKTLDGKEYSGKCVTAYDLDNDRIIRLVSTKSGAPIENPFCGFFEPLNVYDIAIEEPCPIPPQTENVLISYKTVPKRDAKYECKIEDIYEKFQKIDYGDRRFLLDGWHVIQDVTPYNHSLEIVRVSELEVHERKCSFKYGRHEFFAMSLTDPAYKGTEQDIGDAIVVVSIPLDKWEDKGYYKFVAAIYPHIHEQK